MHNAKLVNYKALSRLFFIRLVKVFNVFMFLSSAESAFHAFGAVFAKLLCVRWCLFALVVIGSVRL